MPDRLFSRLVAASAEPWRALYPARFRAAARQRRTAGGVLPPLSDPGLPVSDRISRAPGAWRSTNPTRSPRCAGRSGSSPRHSMSRSACTSTIAAAGGCRKRRWRPSPRRWQTIAYTRFVLDRGVAGDRLDLEIALAPCIVGYAVIAAERMADPATRLDGNPYREWLEMYAGAEYQDLAREAEAALDEQFARRGGEGRFPSLAATFSPPLPGSKPISGRWASTRRADPARLSRAKAWTDLKARRPRL